MPRLEIPSGQYEAYLFDCDGTIADSMPLHYKSWSNVLRDWNCKFSEEQFYAWGGMPIREIIERLASEQQLDLPLDVVAERKEALYYQNLHHLQAVPEVVEHIHFQYGRIPLAVVSGSERASVEASLRMLGLLAKFDALVCAEDYVRSKPDPEPFLTAAAILNVDPKSCLVFEDTQMGIDSAEAAGMAWVRVPPPWERLPG
jgi:HAD superfamily hydrolase (TIGR01509 family)